MMTYPLSKYAARKQKRMSKNTEKSYFLGFRGPVQVSVQVEVRISWVCRTPLNLDGSA